MTGYFVDFENVHLGGLRGIANLAKGDEVYIFCRKADINRIQTYLAQKKIRASVKCVLISSTGKNAMDFSIVAKMGMYHNRKNSCIRMVVSNDKGYDAALETMMREKILCCRGAHIDELNIWPYFRFYGESE